MTDESLGHLKEKLVQLKQIAGREMDYGSRSDAIQNAYILATEALPLIDSITCQHQTEPSQDVVERVAIALAKADGRLECDSFAYQRAAKAAMEAMEDGSATIAPVSAEIVLPITPVNQEFARCERCGWPIVPEGETGCWKSNSSMRPKPLKREQEREISDNNFMTVVIDRDASSFDKNPLHIKSEFGNVVAISRGDALAKLETATPEPVSLGRCAMALQGNERIKLGSDLQQIAKAVLDAAGVEYA